jgi:hypothetical protein
MSHLPLRRHDAKSILPREIRDIPFKGRVADCLGLFGLLVIILGLTCLLSGDPMSIQGLGRMSGQESSVLQALAFVFLGIGQLLFLRKKLPFLLSKRVRLFSREGWYYIGVLSALLVVLLFLLYLFIDSNHLSMVGVSFCSFLLPFTVSNAWEIFRDRRARAATEREKIPRRAVLLCGVTLLLLVGLISLTGSATGRQTAAARPNPEPLPGRSAGKEVRYEEAGRVLSAYTSHLLELDARFSHLAQKDTAAGSSDLAKAREDIKAQEYALGHLLDSLDRRGQGLSLLTTPIRSLLGGHRILSRFQDGQHQDHEVKAQPDSFRDLSSLP